MLQKHEKLGEMGLDVPWPLFLHEIFFLFVFMPYELLPQKIVFLLYILSLEIQFKKFRDEMVNS